MSRCIALLLGLFVCGTAAAQSPDWEAAESSSEPITPDAEASDLRPVKLHPYRGYLRLQNAFHTESPGVIRAITFSPLLELAFRPVQGLHLGARWGLSYLNVRGGPMAQSGARLGNLELSAGYALELGTYPKLFEIQFGGALAAPIASEDEGFDEIVLTGAAGIRGLRDYWLWRWESAAVVMPFAFRSLTRFHLLIELDMALLFPVRDGNDFIPVVQLMVEAGYPVIEELTIGGGVSAVVLPTRDGDQAQTSLMVFARSDISGFLLGTELWLNLDEPYGFAFSENGYWGLMLTLGVGLP